MRVIRTLEDAAQGAGSGRAVAIGNFDGVHRGHRAVIARVLAARAEGFRAAALTFEPHPRQVLGPATAPFRLTPEPAKLRRLAALGLDDTVVLAFEPALYGLTPDAFAETVLSRGLRARRVLVGADFRFGARRAGDVAALSALGGRLGFTVEPVAPALGPDGAVFSSSAVRTALERADPVAAARLLGDWHRIEGVVETGDRRGRDLGFPTANLSLAGVLTPAFGVYAVDVDVLDGAHRGRFPGVASLGVRPTFGENRPNFEAHLFDFTGDLYGATLAVALVAYLRPELRYEGAEALVRQMTRDAADARRALAVAGRPWDDA